MTNPLPARWASRFEFFRDYGYPGSTPDSKAAFKALPFGQRMRLNFNGPAFFFGPIYFLIKGMWRKALTALAFAIVVSVALTAVSVPASFNTAIGVGIGGVWMLAANYAYYLHVTEASTSWNLWEGLSKKAQAQRAQAATVHRSSEQG